LCGHIAFKGILLHYERQNYALLKNTYCTRTQWKCSDHCLSSALL